MRRIITGHNQEGRSVITIDGPPARTIGEDVGGLFEIWNTDGSPINTRDSHDRADSEIILSPPPDGTPILKSSHDYDCFLGVLSCPLPNFDEKSGFFLLASSPK